MNSVWKRSCWNSYKKNMKVIRSDRWFFGFWYAFVFTNYSELEGDDVDGVYEYAIAPQLHEFAASVLEDICREHVREMQKANALASVLPFRYSQMGRWWRKTTVRWKDDKREVQETEIDILAVSKHATQYLVGECKFKNKPFRYSEYLDTIAKLSPQKGKKENISKLAKIRYQMYTINLKDKIYVQIWLKQQIYCQTACFAPILCWVKRFGINEKGRFN